MKKFTIYYAGSLNHSFEVDINASSKEEAWTVFLQMCREDKNLAFAASPGGGDDLAIVENRDLFVDDYSGFNFVKNIHQLNTHIFMCLEGVFICESPKEGEKFKYQKVLRRATAAEEGTHSWAMNPPIPCQCGQGGCWEGDNNCEYC